METLDSENIFTDEELGKILGDLDADNTDSEDQVQEEFQEDDEEVVEDLEDVFSPKDGPKSVDTRNEPPAPGSGSPTPTNLFNSIAVALREEGVFPDTNDDDVNAVTDAKSFRELVDKQIQAGLDERQRRVNEALNYGMQPSEVQSYENAINYLDQVTDDALSERNEQGDEIRRRLIYQDLVNRGYSHDKAIKEVKKSVDAGTDIEDARDALAANKEFFHGRYNAFLENAREQRRLAEESQNTRIKNFEKSLLEDKKAFGTVDLDQSTRRRVFDVLTKPTKKDEDGNYYTEVQWAQREDPDKFSRNVGLLYVLTDGFTNVEKLIDPQVKKRTAKGLAELERVINDTQRNPDGSLRLVGGVTSDPESFLSGDWDLDA